ncbi:MAG: hypothetical protein MZV65_16135 [Chromatiales bacterium]|nr:hypothetical protein [Chromatiales bacterium]
MQYDLELHVVFGYPLRELISGIRLVGIDIDPVVQIMVQKQDIKGPQIPDALDGILEVVVEKNGRSCFFQVRLEEPYSLSGIFR